MNILSCEYCYILPYFACERKGPSRIFSFFAKKIKFRGGMIVKKSKKEYNIIYL